MIEFKLVTTPRLDRFEEAMTNLLNDGWEMRGGIFIASSGAMAQGMTRVKNTPVKKTTNKGPKSEVSE
jgi:hypothetical protein